MRNVVRLAKDLAIMTVAEGVETKEQMEVLREIGCDLGQGYYFSRAVGVGEFERMAFRRGAASIST